MTRQANLFTYPHAAGFRENTTSRDAAEQIDKSGRSKRLRERVEGYFLGGREGTTEEIAAYLNELYHAIQPRISELKELGKVVATGIRRRGQRGGMAHVWRRA